MAKPPRDRIRWREVTLADQDILVGVALATALCDVVDDDYNVEREGHQDMYGDYSCVAFVCAAGVQTGQPLIRTVCA